MLATLVAMAALAQTPTVPTGEPEILGRISVADPAVNESSGLAVSRKNKGVFYTHNDSGDTARFFRFDATGAVTAVFRLEGIQAIDWEDMELQRVGGKDYIYLADCGDNGRLRNQIFVHRVAEPDPSEGNALLKPETYTFVYPDRKNDCECLLVDPASGAIWFVTKARDQKTTVYVCRDPKPGRVQTLELVKDDLRVNTGGIGGNLVTSGDVSPDGKSIVLKTYAGGYIYSAKGRFDSWIAAVPIPVQFPLEKQGEGVCFAPDGDVLMTCSEGSPCPVLAIKAPKH